MAVSMGYIKYCFITMHTYYWNCPMSNPFISMYFGRSHLDSRLLLYLYAMICVVICASYLLACREITWLCYGDKAEINPFGCHGFIWKLWLPIIVEWKTVIFTVEWRGCWSGMTKVSADEATEDRLWAKMDTEDKLRKWRKKKKVTCMFPLHMKAHEVYM